MAGRECFHATRESPCYGQSAKKRVVNLELATRCLAECSKETRRLTFDGWATGISPDGRTLIFTETFPKTGADVMQLALSGTRRVSALVQSEFTERNGIISRGPGQPRSHV
jgi:hypothetical protein